MAEEGECRLSSPSPSTPSEQTHYPYHSYMEPPQETHYPSPRQPQDIASKSLSGLESLVDQIPSITEGETALNEAPDQYSGQFSNYNMAPRASPVPYNYPGSSGYPLYPTPTWSGHYEPMPLAYPQLPPYAQSYAPSLHMPSPNYPYYSYPQPTASHPPGYPPYLGGFWLVSVTVFTCCVPVPYVQLVPSKSVCLSTVGHLHSDNKDLHRVNGDIFLS